MMDATYINALGWTLIHSIWQLTILALLFYVTMLCWKDRPPGYRYRASLLFMLISLSVTSVTFMVMFRKYTAVPMEWDPMMMLIWTESTALEAVKSNWWTSLIHFLQANVTSLTYLYMIGVALLMLRMGINLLSLHRLKSGGVAIDPTQFDFIPELLSRMKVDEQLSIRSSVRAQVPMVIGAFKPVVLIPLSMLSNTPPHILKAIVAHELAHIERHDFATNLVQTLVETLFFYHPAVWYFSYIARREREYCCDQRAVEVGCRREDLVRALTEVGEMQQTPALSMSLRGQSHELLDRVKYLLGMKPSLRYLPDHSIWYYGSLLGVFVLFSVGKSHFFPSGDSEESMTPSVRIYQDSLPLVTEDDEELIVIRRVDTMITIENEDTTRFVVRADTTRKIRRRDSIPRPGRAVVVRSHRDGKLIRDGREIKMYEIEKRRELQDSLRSLHRNGIRYAPDSQKMDSMKLEWKERYGNLMQELKDRYTDSVPGGFRYHPQTRTYSFKMEFPDSVYNYSFTLPPTPPIPPMPPMAPMAPMPPMPPEAPIPPFLPMNLDSLFDAHGIDIRGSQWMDSTMMSLGQGIRIYRDSLVTYFHRYKPWRERQERYRDLQENSREWQELDREIRDKQRELQELRKKQQEMLRNEQEMLRNEQEMLRKEQDMPRKEQKE